MQTIPNPTPPFSLTRWAEIAVDELRSLHAANRSETAERVDELIVARTREMVPAVPRGRRMEAVRTLKSRLRPAGSTPVAEVENTSPRTIDELAADLQARLAELSLEQAEELMQALQTAFPREPATQSGINPAEVFKMLFDGQKKGADSQKAYALANVTEDHAAKLAAAVIYRFIKLDTLFSDVLRQLYSLSGGVSPSSPDNLEAAMCSYAVADSNTPMWFLEKRLTHMEKQLPALIMSIPDAAELSHADFMKHLSPAEVKRTIPDQFKFIGRMDAKRWKYYQTQFAAYYPEGRVKLKEFVAHLLARTAVLAAAATPPDKK